MICVIIHNLTAGIATDETVVITVNDIVVEVTGLTPFTAYSFAVTSENAVSSQATDISRRTCTVIATTLEEGKLNDLALGGMHDGMPISVWDSISTC